VNLKLMRRCFMTVLESTQEKLETRKQPAAIAVKNVLYATDFSDASEAAFPYATAICRKFGSTLHVAHVFSDSALMLMTGGADYVSFEALCEDARSLAQQKVDQIAARLRDTPTRTYVRHGEVWDRLSAIVSENEIDLIVVGTRGRGGLGKFLLGSVAEDILRHAPCPVLTVGPGICGHAKLPEFHASGPAPTEFELRRIVYATNFTPDSLKVAPVAFSLAAQFQSRLTLMHVVEGDSRLGTPPKPVDDDVRKLREEIQTVSLVYVPEVLIEYGSAWRCIVKEAAEREADLLVLGARYINGACHVPWSTVHHVVAHATCPVLTVRA
jgi:nucleotide-binding universal stress UspA family protein